jgi:ABC-2 type transport system permease protein
MVKNMNKNNSVKKKNTRLVLKQQNLLQVALILLVILVINLLSTRLFNRFDLTKEKKFTISKITQNILNDIDEELYIEVYLEGKDLSVEILRYQKIVKEFLNNFSSFSPNITYKFKNPFDDKDLQYSGDVYRSLSNKGLNPTVLDQSTEEGYSQKVIFAGALVRYKNKEEAINLISIQNNSMVYLSETELERDFIHTIWRITRDEKQKIGFLEGHNELSEMETYNVMSTLSNYYEIIRINMNMALNALDEFAAIVIAKPQSYFTERDKYIIDQYIMKGGSVIWLVEWMHITMDSISHKVKEMALIRDINLDDQLFNYGVRINPDLIQDLRCISIPVVVNTIDGQPQVAPRPWFYFPFVVPDTLLNHQLLRNVEPMRTHFVSSIDTVGESPEVKKTILLRTSDKSKSQMHPVEVNLEKIMRYNPDIKTFNKPHIPIAVLLEGTFTSNFANRLAMDLEEDEEFPFIDKSAPNTKMIVISDGDFIRNEIRTIGDKQEPRRLGEDRFYPQFSTPGNSQFFVNCINYLCADNDFIALRMREIKIRTLNSTKVKEYSTLWTYINSIIPVLLILIFGLTVIVFRKYKYNKQFSIYKTKSLNKK